MKCFVDLLLVIIDIVFFFSNLGIEDANFSSIFIIRYSY